jgi:hypothetical protein
MIKYMSGSVSKIENHLATTHVFSKDVGIYITTLLSSSETSTSHAKYLLPVAFCKKCQTSWICLSAVFGISELQFMSYMSGCGLKMHKL